MRTLLIDNYDSYTYNLFQLIAEVNGVEPTVVRNDLPDGERLDLGAFDNIVISPGPGHPARPHDFGICTDVLRRTEIPLLGVCLGHQGIAAVEQGEVGPAPQARHGHLTKVTHDGEDLFAGLPTEFTAVRYHSLRTIEPLPYSLAATAWAEDGVIMGLRHRERPLWGLQFHPESVASEFGRELLANFRDITAERQRDGSSAPAGSTVRVRGNGARVNGHHGNGHPAHSARNGRTPDKPAPVQYHLRVRMLEFAVDTESAFSTIFAGSPNAFWLDSAHVEPGLARFSHLGDGSGPLGESVSYQVGDGKVMVTPSSGVTHQVPGTIFDYLETELERRDVVTPYRLSFDHPCGYVGYFGYELKADCGAANKHVSANPDAQWIFADRAVTVDHEKRRTYILALDDDTPEGFRTSSEWLRSVIGTLVDCAAPGDGNGNGNNGRRRQAAVDPAVVEPWLVRDREQYLSDVDACKDKLLAGESYEICLTNAAQIPATGDGFQFYRELRRCNPAPYGAYLRFDEMHVACSSPERFLRIDRDRVVETKPIKGTARRGSTPEEDEALRAELTTSAKTYAENLMIVDLLRNDLGQVCEVSSVHVPRLMATETYATVHQLVSTVRGTLRQDTSVIDCVRACFPGGSMTGAPKLRTMEIIDSLETMARGVYSGTIGFLGCDGTADLNIVIRTAVLTDGQWHVGAGGAIVLDSDAVEEYDEMLLKATATLRAHPLIGGPSELDSEDSAAEVGVPSEEGSHLVA
ncbi:aminodeoxychorismate synthase component I [Amycolatopsis nigrescens]|uniref:aminodeoxychorismate synthase component I n=1 Tax=Amycolatopsis nigrescens TaxID=381445 RepID=UPI00039EFA75|nr:aminodeoxychorismate synthase component I [Amycolatopsis nigrescens]